MNFHTFGDKENPSMLLIHGALTPWQIFSEQIEHFKQHYYVIVPALDAHEEEQATEYISVSDEAAEITEYIKSELCGNISVLCGLSMGGVIAYDIWAAGKISVGRLILDGAPIVGTPWVAEMVMISNYQSIIKKSKRRDPKTIENFKKFFLPEKNLDSYLKIADNMSEQSVKNIVHSVCSYKFARQPLSDSHTEILFIHGTKSNEAVSAKCQKKLKALYPHTETYCYKGYTHCQAAIYEPQSWIKTVEHFLANGSVDTQEDN